MGNNFTAGIRPDVVVPHCITFSDKDYRGQSLAETQFIDVSTVIIVVFVITVFTYIFIHLCRILKESAALVGNEAHLFLWPVSRLTGSQASRSSDIKISYCEGMHRSCYVSYNFDPRTTNRAVDGALPTHAAYLPHVISRTTPQQLQLLRRRAIGPQPSHRPSKPVASNPPQRRLTSLSVTRIKT
ncbi:hypothetical protein HIM_12681 [Hirsutella minnesotensis 3608]|uniref:Uncharacterized protein n=1 Tax=Hirsutella minnesotensis 3608 TaxID=1043627 RepID=A0A0F7ZHS4_9HYPO|nr:hypothetical protein HIM_12681 [Hirsutella minnesotensis 3608]